MLYYLYRITNVVNNKIYVGVHKTKDINDGYMGSGKIIKDAIKKYGLYNFKKDILEYFENSKSMYAREKEIITDEFLLREDVYNIRRGGHGGFEHINKNRTDEDWSKLGKLARANSPGNKGIERNETWRKNLSKSLKGKPGTFIGKTHTDKTKSVISIKAKERLLDPTKNSQFGTMWITDGTSNKKIMKSDNIPEGWNKGRIMRE